jgi:superfamily II DNA or RNA helicase
MSDPTLIPERTPDAPTTKRRGRPPGAKNKPKEATSHPSNDGAEALNLDSDATVPSPEKRRGRPAKTNVVADQAALQINALLLPEPTSLASSPPETSLATLPSPSEVPTPPAPPEPEPLLAEPEIEEPPLPAWTGPQPLTYGVIKDLAKAGGWRRGYEYYKSRKVQSIVKTPEGALAEVKGNFKNAYLTQLAFLGPDAKGIPTLKPQCTCPLDEAWCKHAVAVALHAVDARYWESHYNLPWPDAEKHLDASTTGRYQIRIATNKKPKFFSYQFRERATNKAVMDVEKVLRALMEQYQASGTANLTSIQKLELKLLQIPVKEGFPKTGDGWYHIYTNKCDTLLDLLKHHDDVVDNQGKSLTFMRQPLTLRMGLNVSMAGNVLVSFHWFQDGPYDAFPLDMVTLFDRAVPWGTIKNRVYPLSNSLKGLPQNLTRNTFTDIRDADGGKFMYEELPRLRQWVEIDQAEIIDQLRLEERPPKKIVKLEMMDEAYMRIRGALHFSYDGHTVAYSKKAPDTPYVMIVRKETETIYWVKRDLPAEKAAYQFLLDSGLEPMQMQFFTAEGDEAIDVFASLIPRLGSDWSADIDKSLQNLKVSKHALKIWAEIDFSEESTDAYMVGFECRVGKKKLDLGDVQSQMVQGKKYFYLDGEGYVEIPLIAMLQMEKTVQAYDGITIEPAVYEVKTFKAGMVAELVDQGVELQLSPKFQKFWDFITASERMEEAPLPAAVNATLRPYQKQGFNWLWFLYSYGLNGILADDMGLGKTLQALVTLQHARDVDGPKPSLIVCPTSVVFNWRNEIVKFTPELKCMELTGTDRFSRYKKLNDYDIILTSYSIMRRDVNALKGYPFRYVILDESQNIKNIESQTAAAAKQLVAEHRLALSGTPIENRLSELWSVFDFLMPGFLGEKEEFRHRFINPIEERGDRTIERRLKKQVSPFILRRMKQDVAQDLPPKIENVLYCELTDQQQGLYKQILERTRDEIFNAVAEKGVAGSQMSILAALLRLRQVCCHPQLLGDALGQTDFSGLNESGKLDALTEMLDNIVAEGHRVLIFSQFVEMLKIVRKWLEARGIRHEYLTGETKATDRESAVFRFNHNEDIPVFLISLKAGGTGLNLTGADYVIHFDPWWNPAAEEQATNRAHRIGQTKNVFVYRIIAKGTVEEKVLKLQDRKRDLVDSIISADRSIGKLLSFEDLKDILSPDF